MTTSKAVSKEQQKADEENVVNSILQEENVDIGDGDGGEVAVKKKRNRNKNKNKNYPLNQDQQQQKEKLAEETRLKVLQMQQKIQLLEKIQKMSSKDLSKFPAANLVEAKQKEFKFWKTQPVPQLDDVVNEYGQIEEGDLDKVRKEPLLIPDGFEWCEVDVHSNAELCEVYTLLNLNYIEDEHAMFRFDYSKDFLLWALTPPGWEKSWHVGIRAKKSGKLVAFICAAPATMRIGDNNNVKLVEINFLCILRKLRAHRLAAVMIKEITRKVHLKNRWVAAYTAGIYLPTPFTNSNYYHRIINLKKLVDVRFAPPPARNKTMKEAIDEIKLPSNISTPGFRSMEIKDVDEARALVMEYLSKNTKVHPNFDRDDFAHWFLNRDGVVNSYVVEDPETKKITDFASFYHLNSTITSHPVHSHINAAYLFYNVATKTDFNVLIKDLLISAANIGIDVCNCLDLMRNSEMLADQKFGKGDGVLQYYAYNYKIPKVTDTRQLGLVML